MTCHDILKIAGTVAIAQTSVDLLARRLIFSQKSYKLAVSALERAQVKRDKLQASSSVEQPQTTTKNVKALDKQAKKVQRAQDEYAEAAAEVAKRHATPSFYGSIVFVMLYRILSIEYSGRVIAILPFSPGRLLRRISQRGFTMKGMEFTGAPGGGVSDVHQACGFLFIYILCTMSVKFIVNKLVGVSAPKGADGGLSAVMASPKSQKFIKSLGVDVDQYKQ